MSFFEQIKQQRGTYIYQKTSSCVHNAVLWTSRRIGMDELMLLARKGLIDNFDLWLNTNHGGIDYFLTQFLNVGLQYYLQKIEKARSPNCVLYNGMVDGVDYTFCSCRRWGGILKEVYAVTWEFSPENVVKEMLSSGGSS